MSRLIKKVSKMEAMLEYGSEYIPSENCHSEFELYYKLGKLEDLEDELGCPLNVVFKALKNNEIYLTHNGEIILDDSPALCFSYEGWYLYTCSGFYEFLKDYKKTWCLKEDLSE